MTPPRAPPLCPWGPCPARVARPTHRLHQAAGAAVEGPAPGSRRAGHSEGHGPGPPDAAAGPAGRGLPGPGAAVDGWEAAGELVAGLGPLQPQCGHRPRGPGRAWRGRGGGMRRGEGARGMASLQEGAQARHRQRLWTRHESAGQGASAVSHCLALAPSRSGIRTWSRSQPP